MKNLFSFLFYAFSILSFGQVIQFEKTLSQAFTKAKQQNKPVFIEYYSPSCPVCKKVAVVLKDPKVVDYYNKNFINYALNIDNGMTKEEENFMKASGLHLDGVPVFLFFDANKNYLHHSSVKADANTIMEIARISLQPNLRNAALAEKYQKGDRSIKTLYAYANLLLAYQDFKKQKEENKAIFWFKLREEWNDKTTFTGFELNSYYGGAIISDDTVTTMILTAKWSQFVLDYQDDIIAELNMVQERYEKYITILRDKQYELKKSINQQQSDINELRKEEILSKLTTEGIELDTNKKENKDSYLPSLEVKFDWTLRSVKALKVLRMTTSKKSADVEVTTRDWQGGLHKTIVERVRMDNILGFVRYNEDIII